MLTLNPQTLASLWIAVDFGLKAVEIDDDGRLDFLDMLLLVISCFFLEVRCQNQDVWTHAMNEGVQQDDLYHGL